MPKKSREYKAEEASEKNAAPKTGRKNGRAIVTYGRSIIALMIAQSLGSRGVDVIGCDDVDLTVLSFSKFVSDNETYSSPVKNPEKFCDDLERIVRQHKPDEGCPYVLIPTFSEGRLIAQHKSRFRDTIIVACPDESSYDKVFPKDKFVRTAQNLGLKIPQTLLVAPEDDIEEKLEEAPLPAIVKPSDEVGGRGVSRQDTRTGIKEALNKLRKKYPKDTLLIQALAEGREYCYCGLYDEGNLVRSMVYRNLRKFPENSGPGVVRETLSPEKFDLIVAPLMKAAEWKGVVEVDLLWDGKEDSPPLMIEVNPRFWAGLDHSIKSNMDFPWMLYQLFTQSSIDQKEKEKQLAVGTKTNMPVLSSLARFQSLLTDTVSFEAVEKKWPDIKTHFLDVDISKAASLFAEALKETFSFKEAGALFNDLRKEAQEAEKISYMKDDPFIGLGVLFILASLIRHGELPPEIKR